MMKKLLALLLCLMLALGGTVALAEPALQLDTGDWYLITALKLADRMTALADNQAYVELFISKQEDLDLMLSWMEAIAGLEPEQVITFHYREDGLEQMAAAYQMEDRIGELEGEAMKEVIRRMNSSLPSLLNGYVGGTLWLAIANALTVGETFLMPDDFSPRALLLTYGEDQPAAVMVTFTQTGEETVTASATFVMSSVVTDEVAKEYLGLLWGTDVRQP